MACMHAFVLTVCTPFSIHNITLWSTCGTPVSPTSSSDPLKTYGSFFACLIALRKFILMATSSIAACCASILLFLCVVETFNEIKHTIGQLSVYLSEK